MITTLTMNPCVDHTVSIHDFRIGETNRVENTRRDVGGKGVNVSAALHQMGLPTRCLCLGHGDGVMRSHLTAAGIPYTLLEVPGTTRVNLKIFDEDSGVMTECNERGASLTEKDLEGVRRAVTEQLPDSRLLTLNGSVPPGVPETFYKELIGLAKEAGVPTGLDAGGALLRRGVEAAPLFIKPNRDELKSAFGIEVTDLTSAARACRELASSCGIGYIALSLGAEGALLVSAGGAWYTKGADIHVRGVQGAGDAMVAGLCGGLYKGETDGAVLLRLAVAAADASLEKPGTQMCTAAESAAMYARVKVETLLSDC